MVIVCFVAWIVIIKILFPSAVLLHWHRRIWGGAKRGSAPQKWLLPLQMLVECISILEINKILGLDSCNWESLPNFYNYLAPQKIFPKSAHVTTGLGHPFWFHIFLHQAFLKFLTATFQHIFGWDW